MKIFSLKFLFVFLAIFAAVAVAEEAETTASTASPDVTTEGEKADGTAHAETTKTGKVGSKGASTKKP